MPNTTVPVRKRAGQRRHRVRLQQGVAVTDELGGRTQTWPEFGQDWAAIDVIPFVVSEIEATRLYQVTTKYRQDVIDKFNAGTTLRLVSDAQGVTLKVLTIINAEERNIELVMHCGQVFDA
jgi:head-tail adaptor